MTKKWIAGLLCSTLICSSVAYASLEDGIKAYEQKKYDKALEEFTYLADENNNIATYYLGLMYENGYGVEKSVPTAAQFYLDSFNAGNTTAASRLGRFLIEGKDELEANIEDGLNLLKTAGRAGDKEALYTLGDIYNSATGVDRDYVIASGYWLLSALKGYAPAQHQLGLLYLFGRGVPQDYPMALRWLSRSATQGYIPAQRDLADLLATNPRMMNVVEAYAWYSILAAYNTDATGTWAANKRDELAARIKKTEDLVTAQQLARRWRPAPPLATVSEAERTASTPIIPGFNDPDTLRTLKEQNIAVVADGSEYGISADDVEQALVTNDTHHIEQIIEEFGSNGRPDAYTYWGKIVEHRKQDPKKAFTWYRKAADKGDAEGAFYVAKAYCEGAVDKSKNNTIDCYKWLITARNTAKEPLLSVINDTIKTVDTQITPEEKNAAIRQVRLTEEIDKKKTEKKTFKLF